MTTVYQLKPRFQHLLRPWPRRLAARGVTPNAITGRLLGIRLGFCRRSARAKPGKASSAA